MFCHGYDPEGNRTLRYVWTDADSDGEVDEGERSQITEYEWDHRNRLVAVIERDTDGGPATQVVEHTYDYLNRWVARAVDSDGDGPLDFVDTYFVYDGVPSGAVSLDRAAVTTDNIGQIVLQFDDDSQSTPQLTHRYLWGAAVDQILADEQVSDLLVDGEVLWALTDHLGTVRDLAQRDPTTGETTIVCHRVYDAFGNLVAQSGAVDHLFGFTGRALDAATALQNNLNRWYDAEVGQWISQDPLGFDAGDTNVQRYVGNEPMQRIDPSGLAWNNWWEGAKAFAYSFYVTGPRNLRRGAWTFVRETGYYCRDVGAVGVDAIATACGHEFGFEEWSQIGKSNQPSDPDFWSNAWSNATRAGAACGTLGITEMFDSLLNYSRTGDADVFQQRMGSIAGAQLTCAGIVKATQVLMGRLTAPSETLPPGFRQTGPNTWEGTIEIDIPEPPTLPAGRGPYGPLEPPGIGPGPGRGPLGPIDRPWYPWWGAGHD